MLPVLVVSDAKASGRYSVIELPYEFQEINSGIIILKNKLSEDFASGLAVLIYAPRFGN